MGKFRILPETTAFEEGMLTERGEKVYKSCEITLCPPAATPVRRVITPDHEAIGFTEEWIEETIQGCLQTLEKDFPNDVYKVVRVKPNQIRFEYAGVRGLVQ